jgi:hypothetical protein
MPPQPSAENIYFHLFTRMMNGPEGLQLALLFGCSQTQI